MNGNKFSGPSVNAGNQTAGLKKYLSPTAVWALAFGCAVGWGAFAMPGSTFLPIAGPIGTVIGMFIGGGVMLLIGANYHFMMNKYADAGGAFTYACRTLGHDHGFLNMWFLFLTYIAIIWANASALPLLVRKIFGGVLEFGFHYNVAGYDVYIGEMLLPVLTIVIFALVCIKGGNLLKWIQMILAFGLIIGVVVIFTIVVIKNGVSLGSLKPLFSSKGSPFAQILTIVGLAMWAYIGFESISHSAEEFTFSPKKSFKIMVLAIIAGALAYSMLAIVASSLQPEGFENWSEYLDKLSLMSGTSSIPTFYAADQTLGIYGLLILGVTVLCGIFTGVIANMIASSRLIYSMAQSKLIGERFAKTGSYNTPKNAILLIALISLPIPFMGRTAIGWIVDITTIGATIVYAYTSYTAFKCALREKNKLYMATGTLGTLISVLFGLYYLFPNFSTLTSITTNSYLILVAWSIIGIAFFRYILHKDTARRFGKTEIVWLSLLLLIVIVSLIWVRQSTVDQTQYVAEDINDYYETQADKVGIGRYDASILNTEEYIDDRVFDFGNFIIEKTTIQMGLVIFAMVIIFSIFSATKKREKHIENERSKAEASSKAKTTFLSNMSHDIRTPMNAIIGYTVIALKNEDISPNVKECLEKIDYSSRHLLSLINDILDMSRIESGKTELDPAPADIVREFDGIRDIFAEQMKNKNITYTVDTSGIKDRFIICDNHRINRIMLNLVSNAFKFTPVGGAVSVTMTQTGISSLPDPNDAEAQPHPAADFELRVKDTGIGMSPEFAATVFNAFERERSSTVSSIQGTGLGMAITKSLVELMGGSIRVETEKGKGTEFIVNWSFPIAENAEELALDEQKAEESGNDVFVGKRILLAEDNPINAEIAKMLLTDMGFEVEHAENGQIAVEAVKNSVPGTYDIVLMDVQMPVMGGYEATAGIRELDHPDKDIIILAMSANAFAEDKQAAENAGMNGYITKPIEIKEMTETLRHFLSD